MRILLINSVCGIGSTGKICAALAEQFEKEGHEVKIAYGRDDTVPEEFRRFAVRIGSDLDVKLHGIRTRIFDSHGFGSVAATKKFLRWAEEFDPQMVWLHNIHGYYINIELLFRWIKSRPQMQVKWTLHDCWAFTGHCAHFVTAKCERWKAGCCQCPEKGSYPASALRDGSRSNFIRKRNAFTGVANMTLIVPSRWLGGLVRQSFLREYPVEVCYNTTDKNVFKPTAGEFRQRHGLEGKKILLGVAGTWTQRKGLWDFVNLAGLLDERWTIVLVGLAPEQIRALPEKIVAMGRTNSAGELAQIYTAADAFFNPTYEDTYPTVNLEAEACGTRVITYDTGGCPETIARADSVTVPVGRYDMVPRLLE